MPRKKPPRKRAARRRPPKADKAFVHYGVLSALEHLRAVRPA